MSEIERFAAALMKGMEAHEIGLRLSDCPFECLTEEWDAWILGHGFSEECDHDR
ncbi:hypothetical protein HMPREF9946_03093 [Acetobacteraceae bacterium AT-5844]|nr:hypothetical protein HMPREF9946_03093 [Acetobacteraceae bacterium AT-5844]